MNSNKQSRKWQLTINNPLPDFTHERIKEILSLQFKTYCYSAICDEIGENGTFHTHLFVCFTSAVRFKTIKRHFPTAHIESARGTIHDNLEYLQKIGKWSETQKAETSVEGSFEEHGTRPPENKGRNIDYENLYRMIVEENLSNAEILRINNDYIKDIDKLDRIRTMHLQDKFSGTRRLNLEVVYVFGITGVGKTRDILDEHGDENCYRCTDYQHPFDGYSMQDVLVLEEFRDSISLKDMLNILDIYPLQLPARYTNRYACYTKVYLCTNWNLEKQYEKEQREDKESYAAFLRRIHKVKQYTKDGVIVYDDVKAYLNRNTNFKPVAELTKQEQQTLSLVFPD